MVIRLPTILEAPYSLFSWCFLLNLCKKGTKMPFIMKYFSNSKWLWQANSWLLITGIMFLTNSSWTHFVKLRWTLQINTPCTSCGRWLSHVFFHAELMEVSVNNLFDIWWFRSGEEQRTLYCSLMVSRRHFSFDSKC